MKHYRITILITVVLLLVICCKKDSNESPKKQGCTDELSTNYDPEAEVDDGSCKYEGYISFWYTEETRQILLGADVQSLTYYIDGESKASNNKILFNYGSDDCEDAANTKITLTGNDATFPVNYTVKDDLGNNVVSGTVHIHANECTVVEIGFIE